MAEVEVERGGLNPTHQKRLLQRGFLRFAAYGVMRQTDRAPTLLSTQRDGCGWSPAQTSTRMSRCRPNGPTTWWPARRHWPFTVSVSLSALSPALRDQIQLSPSLPVENCRSSSLGRPTDVGRCDFDRRVCPFHTCGRDRPGGQSGMVPGRRPRHLPRGCRGPRQPVTPSATRSRGRRRRGRTVGDALRRPGATTARLSVSVEG